MPRERQFKLLSRLIILLHNWTRVHQKKKIGAAEGKGRYRMRKISYLSHDIFILSRVSRMTFMKTELLKEKLIIRPEEGGQLLEIKVEIKSCVHAFRFTTRGNSFVYAFAAHSSTG